MHPALNLKDWGNLFTLVAIFLINLWIWRTLAGRANAREPRNQDVLWAHGFWTANWLAWLFAWITHFKTEGLLLPDILDDVGAFLLIGFALVFTGGLSKLKAYWPVLIGLFIMDILWLATVTTFVAWEVSPDLSLLKLAAQSNATELILNRTILFAPSLCIVVFALGLVAWSFLQRLGELQLSALMAFLTAAYAILHVAFFQVNFFVPGLRIYESLEFLFSAWRIALFIVYSFLILASLGIQVQYKRVLAALGTIGSVVTTILTLLKERIPK